MKPLLLVLVLALGLAVFAGAEKPVVASNAFPASTEYPGLQNIQVLRRELQKGSEAPAAIRDPFALPLPVPPRNENPPALSTPVSHLATSSFPAFKVLGKQQDDQGWAVFISVSDRPEQVWVVREGETFNDTFRISKLAPPILIITRIRSPQGRTFDIGKDEE